MRITQLASTQAESNLWRVLRDVTRAELEALSVAEVLSLATLTPELDAVAFRSKRDELEATLHRCVVKLHAEYEERVGYERAYQVGMDRIAPANLERWAAGAVAAAKAMTVGGITGLTPTQLNASTSQQVMALLGRLTSAQLKRLLKEDPQLAEVFWNNPPSPAAVAAWWVGLDPSVQHAFEKDAAPIIGNLGGIPYTVPTLAADALTQTNHDVASFTMDASAGLDVDKVASMASLHVGDITIGGKVQEAVYTTAATNDHLAPFGSWMGDRFEPNPGVAGPLVPVLAGAESFSSEGDPSEGLAGVDGHGAPGVLHSSKPSGLLNANPSQGHGYFDPLTESLRNTAATTLGMPDSVDGGLAKVTVGTPARPDPMPQPTPAPMHREQ